VESARIAYVQSCWHRDLVDRCTSGFLSALAAELPTATVEQFEVPGAFEIPLRVQLLARSGRFDAIVAAGLVVDGGIYRHEFVADAVISGLMRVQLETSVPVFSAVLTPQQFHEHPDHIDFFARHLHGKGEEVARTCVTTLRSLQTLAS
jgi:6,7-dimethyl-8-ribityllumazine synthase